MLKKIPNTIKLHRKALNLNKSNIEMSIQTISVDFPNDILLALNESENDLKKRIKVTLAIQLYKLQKLTIGKAAQLSGMSRLEFEKELSKNKISISNLNEEDVLSDIEKLK
jgi:predicted HTH domain antitoxin